MTSLILECFQGAENPPQIVPGRPGRAWMNAFGERFPYRCLPMTIANTSGWEILCPTGLTARWNGSNAVEGLVLEFDDPSRLFAASHFSHGIVTFMAGWLFRTPKGWATLASGPPNAPKHGIAPLTGLVETDWLPFPFTMNWLFTAPGVVRFEKDEPFCFISLVENAAQDAVQPVIRAFDDDPTLKAEYEAWTASRAAFNAALEAGDAEVLKQSWQRSYFKGEPIAGEKPEDHVHRRRLRPPIRGERT